MGRGRAKAKQTKVARQLKYSTPDTDLEALQQELSGRGEDDGETSDEFDDEFDDARGPYEDALDDARRGQLDSS